MDRFINNFNQILVDTYHSALLMEETKRKYSSASFSFRDRNAIELLARNPEGKNISDVDDFLKISRPSATIIIKKLEKNGLVERCVVPGNNRNTLVKITRKGRRFSLYQAKYRERLAKAICKDFTEEERNIAYESFRRLNEFCVQSIKESEEIHKRK